MGNYETPVDQFNVKNIDITGVVIGNILTSNAMGGAILDEEASSTNPTILPNKSDFDTGLGHAAEDSLSIVVGNIEAIRYTEGTNKIIVKNQTNTGLTANSGSSQGDGVITSSYNIYDTVGTAGDAATLPSVFIPGTIIYIKNGAAANSMDVFPASGDDLGQGANTQEALAAGDFAVYIGTTANATWEKLMGGTA